MTLANLRGVKESGLSSPSRPTSTSVALGRSSSRALPVYFGDLDPSPAKRPYDEFTDNGALLTGITLFALMRAFSSGAVALTGVEAISDGVPAFQARGAERGPHPDDDGRHPRHLLLRHLAARPPAPAHPQEDDETVLSILARRSSGGHFLYYVLQFSTFAILILAANTAFADFPRLSSIIARDGTCPASSPTGATGWCSPTASSCWPSWPRAPHRVRAGSAPSSPCTPWASSPASPSPRPGWSATTGASGTGLAAACVNLVGAVATGIVLVVVVVSKFTIGAWIPAVVIPVIVLVLLRSAATTSGCARPRSRPAGGRRHTHTVVVLVGTRQPGALAPSPTPGPWPRPAPRRLRGGRRRAGAAAQAVGQARHPGRAPHPLLALPGAHPAGPRYLDELDAEYHDDIIT